MVRDVQVVLCVGVGSPTGFLDGRAGTGGGPEPEEAPGKVQSIEELMHETTDEEDEE